MASYSRPGVYVEELPGQQLISQVSTSNAAFVGRSAIGPTNTYKLITSWNAFVAEFGGFAWGAQLPFAVYSFFAQGGAICYVVRAEAPGETPAVLDLSPLTIKAATPGTWGNDLCIQITNAPPEQPTPSDTAKPIFAINVLAKLPDAGATLSFEQTLMAQYAASNSLAPVTISGEKYYPLESYSGLSKADLAKGMGDGAVAPIETRINPNSLFIRAVVAPGTDPIRPDNVAEPEPLADGTGDSASTPLKVDAAMVAFDGLTGISLLIAPDTAMIESLETQRNTAQEILTYCEDRPHHDLFAILDPPLGLAVSDIETYKTGGAVGDAEAGTALHSSYGALYYPWIEILDPASSRNLPVPPSGTMAGTYAATDIAVGPWQSPAGITHGVLNVATNVSQTVTPAEQSILNPNGVNAIIPMIGQGIVAYGARTLTTDTSLQYVAVRRTLMDIEVSLYNGLQWVVFQPNTPNLWGAVLRDVTEFLTDMWRQGALVGQKASEAFQVQCDASNNPPDLQRKGQLHVDVAVAPSYPGEFVIVRIQQTTLGAS